MSQSSKKGKLSLNKAGKGSKPAAQSGNTIISLFKRQADKQATTEIEPVKESGSEGDVVITNVIGLNIGLNQSAPKSVSDAATVHNRNQTEKGKGKLSLSGRKRSRLKDTNHPESDSDSDFGSDKLTQKKKKSRHHKLSRSSSEGIVSEGGSPYKLRKRNTVPIVEVSDSETEEKTESNKLVHVRNKRMDTKSSEFSEGDKVDSKAKTDTKNITNTLEIKKSNSKDKSRSKRVDLKSSELGKSGTDKAETNYVDDDEIIEITKSDSKSRYFNNTNKRKSSSPTSRKTLSLKRTRSGLRKVKQEEKSQVNESEDNRMEMEKGHNSSEVITEYQEAVITKVSESVDAKKHTEIGLQISKKSVSNNVNNILMSKQLSSKNSIENETKSRKLKKTEEGNSAKGKKKASESGKESSKRNSKTSASKKQDEDDNNEATRNAKAEADSDSGGDDVAAKDSETTEFRVPYYLENFNTIMKSVLDDEENARLFDDDDTKYIETFNQLEESSQKLYVRLFSRKLSWLPLSKVNYPEIGDNIPELTDTLISVGLLQSGAGLSDLLVVLKILSAPDLKGLAKSFHINCQGMTKHRIIEELMKKSQHSSISSMFKGGSTGTMEKTILNRAKTYMGKVCRLEEEPRAVFIRILMLFSLYNTNFDEESGGGGQGQLFQMLMVNIGRVVYPSYTVNRNMPIFQDRAALVRFETALQFEMDIQAITDRGKWTQAFDIYKQAKEAGKPVLKEKKFLKWDSKLPQFLRLYTAGSVYTRIDNQGVEILQRLKLYKEAVQLLEDLLSHELYCIHYRGHWFERLALNLEAHLKSVEKSLSVIKRGLSDPKVRTGRRLALYERARKICEAPKSKYADRMTEFEHQEVLPTPEVCIEGMVISDATSVGMKYQFVMHGDLDSVTLCAVEELVLEHYKQNGYPEGLHAEGSIVSNLFVLLFWDIMFMDVPNVFHGPFQSCPLDIATRDFYFNRQPHIDERLVWLKNATVEELIAEVARTWMEHEGKMCSGINWEKFSGPEKHQNLISCMGGPVVSGMLERFVKDPRHTRSGFPDLTLWNFDTKEFKICEVKGPNDRLSYKQILWIDYLIKLGVDAEVCYVKAVGSKRLKPVTKN